MVAFYPPPDYRSLLPPLLASLPTAFVSPRPPPALLPLLTSILRQRVQFIPSSGNATSESWLKLLCWESQSAQRLADIVADSDAFELHPVSGEIDFGDVEAVKYRRLDAETLQSRVAVPNIGIVVIYLWCEGDPEGGPDGWRISEVTPLEGEPSTSRLNWSPTVAQADEKSKDKMLEDAIRQGQNNSVAQGTNARNGIPNLEADDEDEGDYWALYDKTPAARSTGRTPDTRSKSDATTSEADYFGQYAQVQPALDNDDPSEDHGAIGASSLDGNVTTTSESQLAERNLDAPREHALPNGSGVQPANADIAQPDPSMSNTPSASIPRLQALAQAQDDVSSHISASVTALYGLARKSGVKRRDFDRMVRSQLDALELDDDEV